MINVKMCKNFSMIKKNVTTIPLNGKKALVLNEMYSKNIFKYLLLNL